MSNQRKSVLVRILNNLFEIHGNVSGCQKHGFALMRNYPRDVNTLTKTVAFWNIVSCSVLSNEVWVWSISNLFIYYIK